MKAIGAGLSLLAVLFAGWLAGCAAQSTPVSSEPDATPVRAVAVEAIAHPSSTLPATWTPTPTESSRLSPVAVSRATPAPETTTERPTLAGWAPDTIPAVTLTPTRQGAVSAAAQDYCRAAQRASQEGQSERALEEVDRALALAPDHAGFLALRGRLLVELAHPVQGEQTLRTALSIDPFQADARWSLTELYVGYRLWPEAQAECMRYLELSPGDVEGWFTLGQIREHQNRAVEAMEAYSQTLTLDPEHEGGLARRYALRLGAGALRAAWTDLSALLQLEPTLDRFQQRAELNLQLGEPLAAAADWRSALALMPAEAPTITLVMEMGAAYLDGGAAEEAVVAFRTGVSLTATADAQLWLGESLLAVPDPHSALEVFSNTVPSEPQELVRLLTGRGRARLGLEAPAAAVADLSQVLDLVPALGRAAVLAWRSEGYEALGRTRDAIADLTEALRLGGEAELLYRRALLYLQEDDREAAIADLTLFLDTADPLLTSPAALEDARTQLDQLEGTKS